MKRLLCTTLILIRALLADSSSSLAQQAASVAHSEINWQFISPQPNSEYHHPETNIILRASAPLSQPDLLSLVWEVSGSLSGNHSGSVRLADDGLTILFKPSSPFYLGERVSCIVKPGEGSRLPKLSFTFSIINKRIDFDPTQYFQQEMIKEGYAANTDLKTFENSTPLNNDSLPSDFPSLTSVVPAQPSSDYLYLSNITFGGTTAAAYLMIVDNGGHPIFQRRMGTYCYDFTKQQNGLYTYYQTAINHYRALDDQFRIVDSFKCGNGYTTDLHELRLLPNGHVLLMSYDPVRMDFSNIVDSGRKNAIVIGLVIQEIDQNKDVVFQWRSWDHFAFPGLLDARALRDSVIDYVHGNAIDATLDGNIVISSRHLSEITKISRTTGEILWRWGGAKNQFTFVNDSLRFTFQHCIRQLPNGNFLMFDNGNYHPTPRSRAVEYKLDESAKTATLVWQYQDTALIYGWAMGSVQRLKNGNTIIGWGATNPTVTEVTSTGEKVLELTLPKNSFSYRVTKADWAPSKVSFSTRDKDDIQLYPNPAMQNSVVKLRQDDNFPSVVSLADVTGRIVYRKELAFHNHEAEVNVSTLKPGIYFLQVSSAKQVKTARLVIAR